MGGYIKVVDKMDVEWVTDDVNHWVIGSESVIGTGPHSVTIHTSANARIHDS